MNRIIGYRLFAFLTIFVSHLLWAQDEEPSPTIPPRTGIAKAANRLQPIPKILEFKYTFLYDFIYKSSSEEFGDSEAEVDRNTNLKFKMRFPLYIKKRFQILGTFKYEKQNFSFDNIRFTDYEIYERLENESLNKVALSIIFRKKIKDRKYLYFYSRFSLNSDKIQFKNAENQLKTNFTFLYSVKKNPHTDISVGAGFGFNFGRPLGFPVFRYKHGFSHRFSTEIIIPKKLQFNYAFSEKMYAVASANIMGNSYHLQDEPLNGIDNLEFRQSMVKFALKWERQLYDFIWAGANIGQIHPLNVFFSPVRGSRNDSYIQVNPDPAWFYEVILFFVVPQKLVNKAKSR